MLRISLLTLGSPDQLTGGYLYHRRMAEAAADHDAQVEFVSLPPSPFPLPAAAAAAAWRRAQSADVVAVDSIAVAFLAPVLLPRILGRSEAPVPLVGSVHQRPGGIDHGAVRAMLQAPLDRLVYRRCRRLMVASHALADELIDQGFGREVVQVVPPGRDVGEPPPGPPPELRAGRGAAILSVGNWVPRKGTLDLLEAFARLPGDAATLYLVGRLDVERAYAARVRARLAAADLVGRVVVHGPVSRQHVARLYRAADLFVLPSRQEPYGTVYGEALAAGLPVVGWRAGNLPHLVTHGREGLVVEPGDIGGLAQALQRLAYDEPLRARMAQAARRRGAGLPTWEHSAALFFEVLREAAGYGR